VFIKIKIEDLKPILSRAIHAVPKKPLHIPALSCFRLYFRKDSVVVESSDLHTRFVSRCAAEGQFESDTEVAIPAADFCKYIESLDDKEVIKLEIENNTLKLKRGRSLARFNIANADGFPGAPRVSAGEKPQKVLYDNLRELIKTTLPFVSKDETRPILGGVCLLNNEIACASNGHHVMIVDNPDLVFKTYGYGGVISKDILETLLKCFKSGDELEVLPTDNYCYFRSKDALVGVMVQDFQAEKPLFPDVKRVIPGPSEVVHSGTIKTEKIAEAIKRMLLLTKGAKMHHYVLSFTEQALELRFDGEDGIGEMIETVEGDFFQSSFAVALNPVYLLSYLESVKDEDNVYIGLCGPLKPVIFKTEGKLYAIMPIKKR
jgi:DNA polymerase III sliding clamp (beta) subunit (PCNA family)